MDLGWFAYYAGHFREAIGRCEDTLRDSPGYAAAHVCIVRAAVMLEDFELATVHARALLGKAETVQILPPSSHEHALREALHELVGLGMSAPVLRQWVPTVHTMLGHHEQALEQFEQVYRSREGEMLLFIPIEPVLEPIRTDDRFEALVARLQTHRSPTPVGAVGPRQQAP